MARGQEDISGHTLWRNVSRLIGLWKLAMRFNPKQYWTERGRTYIAEYPPGGSKTKEVILATLATIEFESLLDVGCGYGRYLKCIADRFPGAKLAGVDISPTQIAEAKRYLLGYPEIELRETDGLRLSCGDKSFDLSFTYGCMKHVPKDRIHSFFKELCRVTRHKGLFIEASRKGRRTLKQILIPEMVWYSHKYDELFRHFRKPHEIVAEWEPAPGLVERLYLVDFA